MNHLSVRKTLSLASLGVALAMAALSTAHAEETPAPKKQTAIALAMLGEVPAHYVNLKRDIHGREGYDSEVLTGEIQKLRNFGMVINANRGFGLLESFAGTYFNTDLLGRRVVPNQPANPEKLKGVGFFGGSTAFSMGTDDGGAVPGRMQKLFNDKKAKVPVFNYGVPGYASTLELTYFIEATRLQPMSVAVFYDGTNEIVNYMNQLQSGAQSPMFEATGYPFYYGLARAIANIPGVEDGHPMDLARRHQFYAPLVKPTIPMNGLITPENVEGHAKKLLALYEANVKDITTLAKAKGIRPVFVWQPDIYLTKKPMTADEALIHAQFPAHRLLAETVKRHLFEDVRAGRLKDATFIDTSNALDDMSEAAFFDFCHTSRAANERVAQIIMTELSKSEKTKK